MTMLLRIAERVLNRPLLVHPDKVPVILGVLEGRIPLGDVSEMRRAAEEHIEQMPDAAQAIMRGPSPGASRFVGSSVDRDPMTGRETMLPYRRTSEGVAVITVTGSLVNRGAWVGSNSGETSYEGIKHQVATAANDPRAHSILIDIESPGGEAAGAFEAADAVRTAAAKKPVVAVVNGMAASAAYALASGATRIVTTQTGLVGSIGVVMMHADYSRFLDKKGITPTLIFAGAHKVDGNPYEPLSADVRDDLQREVNQFYDLFVETVASGRKHLSSAAIRGTEARTFMGAEAVELGLADSVGTFEDVLAEMSRGPGRTASTTPPPKGPKMERKEGEVAAATATISKADLDAAVAAARAEGVKEGATAERERIAGIEKLGMTGHEALISLMKADGTSVEQAAMKLVAAEKAQRDAQLAGIKSVEDKTGKVAAAVPSAAEVASTYPATADGWKQEYAETPSLQTEFASADDYVAFRANAHKVRILGRKSA
jgi:capsid assembly protease